ncbi:SIR2 family anti-phage-associated protein [Aeromonas enterica]
MVTTYYQGGNEISLKDIENHLSSLCQLENVGILLGAGASKSAGGKVMKEIWLDFKNNNPGSVTYLTDKCNLITSDEIEDDSVNVEILIDQVLKFIDVESTKNENTQELELARIALYRSVINAALLVGTDFPISHVGKKDNFDKHRNLLEKLLSNRQPGQSAPAIFTTNYDLAIEWAAEESGISIINGFSGIHSRTFQPHSFDLGFRNVNAIGEARFGHYCLYLYKLHGSLTWHKDINGDISESTSSIVFKEILSPLISGSDISHKQHLIFPGANKYHHTIGFVYGEMFRRFSEFLSKPQAALFINGYGFGDYHINRLILGALLNPSLHIVICYPEMEFLNDDIINGKSLTEAQKCIDKIRKMKLNQITLICGESAYFNNFVDLIPKPVLFPRSNAAQIIAEAIRDVTSQGDNI